ncbi:MAG TPA: putative zinc-binding peptidase [Polyangiaceae bacterium]|nr:putative zinc-binding peptidase [Polyangiaceae bacterium]
MKLFSCSACQQVAFFENSQCTRCGHTLAYLPDRGVLSALEPDTSDAPAPADGHVRFLALDPSAKGARYRLCQNYATYAVCNWAIPEHDPNVFCPSCRLNETIPNLSAPSAIDSWRGLEIAKRRLVYTLLALGLPLESKDVAPRTGLAFAFKQDGPNGERVLTGHCDGLVTINVAEVDPSARESTRAQLGERYRTLLGHFRHESGHYYWARLIEGSASLHQFRNEFGNEQENYDQAVRRYYAGPRQDWAEGFVSPYATAHPWEDWAETWAHYLHMVDTLETAQSHGLALQPQPLGGTRIENVSTRRMHFDDFGGLVAAWMPVTVALNNLNRSMGLPDLYPFVLGERAISKLRFVHQVIVNAATGLEPSVEPPQTQAAPEPPVRAAS